MTTPAHSITQIVKNTAYLISWQDGVLTYSITVSEDVDVDLIKNTSYTFPINTDDRDDVGKGDFRRNEKGIMLLRWLQKAFKDDTVKVAITETNMNM